MSFQELCNKCLSAGIWTLFRGDLSLQWSLVCMDSETMGCYPLTYPSAYSAYSFIESYCLLFNFSGSNHKYFIFYTYLFFYAIAKECYYLPGTKVRKESPLHSTFLQYLILSRGEVLEIMLPYY